MLSRPFPGGPSVRCGTGKTPLVQRLRSDELSGVHRRLLMYRFIFSFDPPIPRGLRLKANRRGQQRQGKAKLPNDLRGPGLWRRPGSVTIAAGFQSSGSMVEL